MPWLLACLPAVEVAQPPAELDRQCRTEGRQGACPQGLLCVRLRSVRIVVDGGVVEADSFTCRLPCAGDADCPATHRCYRPMPPPMRLVCVRAEVVEHLEVARTFPFQQRKAK
ncbi:MAG: hypothetical protein RMK29_03340 [Myxococcales bacterium]|nr:hypothetical protein [Myxococcota bacterium]MDW8280719.1 hypothetical protein [Myxococcales bacterium]